MVKVMKKGFASVHRKAKRKGIEGKRKIFMYRKDSEKWLKHLDFIALDMICLQLAFMFAYAIRGYGMNVYGDILYRNMAVFLGLADLVVIFMAGTMKNVLKRGHYKEFVSTLNQAVIVGALAIICFLYPKAENFGADNLVYHHFNRLDIEVYTDYKDPDMEVNIEEVLTAHELYYEKSEVWIETEKMYEVLYELTV